MRPAAGRVLSYGITLFLGAAAALALWLLRQGGMLTMADEGPVRLEGASPVVRRLAADAAHEYRVPVAAGEFVEVVAEQRGADVVLRLLAAGGTALTEVDSPTGAKGEETLAAVADAAEELRIEVRSGDPATADGEYAIRIAARRPATAADRSRVTADRAFAEGEGRRRSDQPEEAIRSYQRAADLRRTLGDKAGEAMALFRVGWVHQDTDRWEEALKLYDRALPLYRESRDVAGIAALLNRRGRTLRSLGRYDAATAALSEAVEAARAAGDLELAARALNSLGSVHDWCGRTQQAADAFDEALALQRQRGDRAGETVILLNLGDLYMNRGRRADARDAYEAALALATERGDRERAAFALTSLGELDHREHRLEEARRKLEQALVLRRETGDRRGESVTLNSLGAVLVEAGDFERARETYEQALAISRELGDRSGEAFALSGLGQNEYARGDAGAALERHRAALVLFERLGDRPMISSSHFGCGRALARLGRLEEARQHLETSLGFVEGLRTESSSLELRSSFFGAKQHYWDLYIEVLMRLHEQYPLAGYEALAFQAAERRRSRSLLDALGAGREEIRRGADPELAAQERALLQRLDLIERDRVAAAKGAESTASAKLEELDRQARQALAEVHRVRARMAGTRLHAELVDPQTLGAAAVQSRLLTPGTLLLSYSLGEERSFLWTVSRQTLTVHVLARRQRIEEAAARLHELLARSGPGARTSRERAAADLSDLVLLPAAEQVGGTSRLVIVGDGALLRVPFAALPEPGRGGQPLVAGHEIVYLPSASVLATLRERAERRVRPRTSPLRLAVVADPVFTPSDARVRGASRQAAPLPSRLRRSLADVGLAGVERLPHTRREAEMIMERLGADERFVALDFDATRELVTSGRLRGFPILHFATHGIVNDRQPELSGLVLSMVDEQGRPRDGFLRLYEIYDLDLTAELVVLSACQTGVGVEVRGEGLQSLTRGFMYAGVPQLVVSLWKVEDSSTAELMRRFYAELLEEGRSPAAALRRAQLAMLREVEWSDSYQWAGFVFQGDYGDAPDGGIEATDSGGGSDEKHKDGLPVPVPPPAAAAGPVDNLQYFNGVDGSTGRYLAPPVPSSRLLEFALQERVPEEAVEWLARWSRERDVEDPLRRPIVDVERPWDLAETGWAVVFGPDVEERTKRSVRRLLDHRRDQVGREDYVRESTYRGEPTHRFLELQGANPKMVADPDRYPFYVLLVGDPESLPYSFQYELDVNYAVGRLWFEKPEEYEAYVDGVIAAERRPPRRPRDLAFFGAKNANDRATQRTAAELVERLAPDVLEPGMKWRVRQIVGEEAKKERLKRLLGGDETPGVLFTATHGLGFPDDDPRQPDEQGALVCQEWQGPEAGISPDQYFAAADLDPEASLHGLVAFLFACHSAGTPTRDNFAVRMLGKPQRIAPKPLVSLLPRRLLAHPGGGALAVVGHVDRAWTTSFEGSTKGEGCDVYRGCLRQLLRGHTIGYAMQFFNQAYAALATQLDGLWQGLQHREAVDLDWLAWLWGTSNDARNFVLFGDPAVRLPGAGTPPPVRG